MTPEEIRKFGEEMLEACKKVQSDGIKVGPKIVYFEDSKVYKDFAHCCPLGALAKVKGIKFYGDYVIILRPSAVACSGSSMNISEDEARGFIQGFENHFEIETDGDILFYQLGRRFRKLALNNWVE